MASYRTVSWVSEAFNEGNAPHVYINPLPFSFRNQDTNLFMICLLNERDKFTLAVTGRHFAGLKGSSGAGDKTVPGIRRE